MSTGHPDAALAHFFFFNDTATTEIYPLPYTTLFRSLPHRRRLRSAHLRRRRGARQRGDRTHRAQPAPPRPDHPRDRKSTRLNSSHSQISYAVFCLKKKKVSRHDRWSTSQHGQVAVTHASPRSSACPPVIRTPHSRIFFFLMIRRPPRSTLFPTRRSSDLYRIADASEAHIFVGVAVHGSEETARIVRNLRRHGLTTLEIGRAHV